MSKRSKIAKLQKQSNYNGAHRFDIETIKNVELRRKTLKTTQNAKLQKQSNKDQFASIWRQNDQKCWVTSQNILNNAKLQNWSNYNELHRFDVKTVKNRKTTKGIKFRSICIDLRSKRSKMLSYVANHSKQPKTTKVIKLQWIASIWCQKHQTNAKLQKWSYLDEFASIWRQNDQNNAKLRKWSNYNELHRFDVKTIKNRKTTKAIKLLSICIDLTSKRSKMLSYVPKLQKWSYFDEFASIWRQNDQNNAKLRKWSNYNALHRFDVKTI